MTKTINSLAGVEKGSYIVETRSGSAYLVNFDKQTLERIIEVPDGAVTAPEVGTDKDYGQYNETQTIMRADNLAKPLVEVVRCEVGLPARFYISGVQADPTAVTTRDTTNVERILIHF